MKHGISLVPEDRKRMGLVLIQTILQNCRRCYSCVRECPAKAIKIVDGQASVVPERCIACGNCYQVCPDVAITVER